VEEHKIVAIFTKALAEEKFLKIKKENESIKNHCLPNVIELGAT